MSVIGVSLMTVEVLKPDVVPPYPSTSFLTFIIIGGLIVLGILFALGLLLLLRIISVSRVTVGAVTVTIASMVLLSGLWCAALSPTRTEYKYDTVVNSNPLIGSQGTWVASINLGQGDTMSGSIGAGQPLPGLLEPLPEKAPPIDQELKIVTIQSFFSVSINDPTGAVVWSVENVTYATFNIKAPKSGVYTSKIHNPQSYRLTVYITVSRVSETVYRPLQPLGEWLSLVSLPVIGLGVWAARYKPKQEVS